METLDVAYVVKGYLTKNSKEQSVLYVGVNPKKAYSYLDWDVATKTNVEIWIDGALQYTISQHQVIHKEE